MAINRIQYNEGTIIGNCAYIKEAESTNNQRYAWFICECGKEFKSNIQKVKRGDTTSCGCARVRRLLEMNGTHMMTNSQEYTSWVGMKQRCNNPNNNRYRDWGGRGIRVCTEWQESFEAFLRDMGPKPSSLHELDRFPDKNGNYEKGNCRWATRKQQSFNRRSNRMVLFQGESKPLKEWTDVLNLNYHNVYQRVVKLGWDTERAFK